ncbi:ChaN family lipoprotein [Fulvivirgaceae bacterium PWU5]|uniref:ChaN family lipoprotein n=1 Tax=Dawidia cretensis TaxID=2782350 RepID=A0AAP2E3E8_9BACT|nr:ChaN family lipoprotein [Dawidia cretensis]MBT1710839.1 ChaN family lipoprotein [Dawidia cretensis]
MRTYLACLLLLIITTVRAQDKPAYKLFTPDGKGTDYTKMIKALAKADIVLFGELHDDALDHWLELQVAKDLYALRNDLALGLEMFEADDQIVLDEYLTGVIEERHLLSEAKVWENYKTDYKPLIEFAKEKKLPAVATNPPRRYANLVYRKGIEALQSLPEDAKRWIAPLPIEIDLTLPGYKSMASMGGHGTAAPANDNMAKSQAVKDATMAHFIIKNRKGLFLHYHGAYHSRNFEGIVWYLKKAAPDLKIVTIHSVEQASIDDLENENRGAADFIIAIPKDMTKTY